jgi:hypothetical protein
MFDLNDLLAHAMMFSKDVHLKNLAPAEKKELRLAFSQ